ncbi:hypothetical protein F4782DRAFT_529043 [Xylaria castorea]|nr:hypothetical protein F4782DRAFT_529043 [Xylaria castorea]
MILTAAIVYARRRFRRRRISNRPRGSYRGGDTLLAIYDKSPRRLQVEYALEHPGARYLAGIGREDAFDVFQTYNSSALSPTDIIEAQKSLYPQPTGLKETRDDGHGTRHFLMRLAIMLVKVFAMVDGPRFLERLHHLLAFMLDFWGECGDELRLLDIVVSFTDVLGANALDESVRATQVSPSSAHRFAGGTGHGEIQKIAMEVKDPLDVEAGIL